MSSIGIQSQLDEAYPKEYASSASSWAAVQDEITLGVRPALLALSGAVLLVLLIAVANVVSLQLARAIRRAPGVRRSRRARGEPRSR